MRSFIVILAMTFGIVNAFDLMETLTDFDDAFPNDYFLDVRVVDDSKNSFTTASDFIRHVLDDQQKPYDELNEDEFDVEAEVEVAPLPVQVIDELLRLQNDPSLSEAKEIFTRINLRQMIIDLRPTTLHLFAPNNDAIIKWKKQIQQVEFDNVDLLTELVKAWVVPNSRRFQGTNDMMLPTLRSDVRLRYNAYTNVVSPRRNPGRAYQNTVNGARLSTYYRITQNCILHVTRDVIYPLPDGTITQELKKAGKFTKFIKMLGLEGQRMLDRAGMSPISPFYSPGITVFAPSDDALEKLPKSDVDQMITYGSWTSYVTPNTVYSAGLSELKPNTFTCLDRNKIGVRLLTGDDEQDDRIELDVEGIPSQTKPVIIKRDIPAKNGVIQVINRPLPLRY